MKIYILTRHHDEGDMHSFMTAAFSTRKSAQRAMRESFHAAVDCFTAEGIALAEEDIGIDEERAYVILSRNERDERQWHITEAELDDDNFSHSAYLD